MNSQDKAKDLINTFYYLLPNNGSQEGINSTTRRYAEAKQCALFTVDEILRAIKGMVDEESGYSADEYYLEVKQEIEKL